MPESFDSSEAAVRNAKMNMPTPLHEESSKSARGAQAEKDDGRDSSSSSSSDEERVVLSSDDESSISSFDEDDKIAARIKPPLHKHHASSHPMSQEEALCLYQDRSKYRTEHSILRRDHKDSNRKKGVKFATHERNDKVWSFIKASPIYPDFLKDDLWWSKNELENCYDDELKFLETYQRLYKSTLRNAFLSCKDEETDEKTVALCFHSMLQCSDVRGLEREVVPQLKHYKKKHRRAVLAAIETSHNLQDPKEWEFIKEQSVAFSRPCRLVMTKLGEFDQLSAWPESTEMPPPITPSRGNRRPLRRTYSYSSSDNETTPENRRMLLRKDNSARKLGDLSGQQLPGNRKPLLIDDDNLSLKDSDSPRRNSWTLSLPENLLANNQDALGQGAESDSNLSLKGSSRRRLRRIVQRHDSTDSGDFSATEDRRPQFQRQHSARPMQQNGSDEQPSQHSTSQQNNADSGDEDDDAPDPYSLIRSNRTFRRQFRRKQSDGSSNFEDRRSLLQKQDSAKGMSRDAESKFNAPKRRTSDSSNDSNRWDESASGSSNTPSRKIGRNRTPRRHLKRNPQNLNAYLAPSDNEYENVTPVAYSESSLSSHEGQPRRVNLPSMRPQRRRSNSIESQSSQDTAPKSILSSERRVGQWHVGLEKPTTLPRVSSADSLSSLDSAPRPMRRFRESRQRLAEPHTPNDKSAIDNLVASHSVKSLSSNDSKNSHHSIDRGPMLPRSDSSRSLASDVAPKAPVRRTTEISEADPSRGVMPTNSSRSNTSDSAPKIARRAASPLKETLSMKVEAS